MTKQEQDKLLGILNEFPGPGDRSWRPTLER